MEKAMGRSIIVSLFAILVITGGGMCRIYRYTHYPL